MAKKERRPKGPGVSGGARNKDAAKQKQAAASRSRKSPSPTSNNNHLSSRSALWLVRGIILSVLALLLFVFAAKTEDDHHDDGQISSSSSQSSDDRLVPNIDGIAMELNTERGNETLDFLNNFVCKYQPTSETEAEISTVDVEGYCHPKLSAVPEHRTHRVIDHGIPSGDLVVRLPRPLQIWDLDALRDKFIQQEFLGLVAEGDGDGDELEQRSIARHKDTQNPLDSGAYLAVYLLRLLHGSRAKGTSTHASNDEQCQNESGECKLVQRWNDFEQHKERISILSDYLDILPNTGDRMHKQGSSNINPHSHPSFWSSNLQNKMYPPYTHTHDLILHYQKMIESEYDALKQISDQFRENVYYLEYLTMRINVLSRAFGVPAATGDNGALFGLSGDMDGPSLSQELRSYETSNFGSSLAKDVDEFKLRSMCPLLDMYNSHPNPNVSWRYDSKTSSYLIHASKSKDIPPGHSIVVSYGKYTEGHLFAKYGYVNGDGSSPTEISLAIFHRLLGDVGLGQQYSHLPFHVWDRNARVEMFTELLDGGSNVDSGVRTSLRSAKQALEVQKKELLRYLLFDDGYKECIDLTANPDPSDKELKVLKLRHLIRIANDREAWVVRIPAKSPDAQPLQSLSINGKDVRTRDQKKKKPVALNANRIVSVCRLLSLRVDDIGGDAIHYLKEGLSSAEHSESTPKNVFMVENHGDPLEYRAMMCVVRLCNAALSRYVGYDNSEPDSVGSREWNAWYITAGEVRGLGILQQTAVIEATRLERQYSPSTGSVAMRVREEGACPLNYTLPLLSMI